MARRMRTNAEFIAGVSIFDTFAWRKRKQAIYDRVNRIDRTVWKIIDKTTPKSNEITLQLTWWQQFIIWLRNLYVRF